MTIDPKLLEAAQFIKDAGDRDAQEIVDELQASRPIFSLVLPHPTAGATIWN